MIFEKGVQVQADYGNSMDCFIMAGEYVYAEAAKSAPIRGKHGKLSELMTFEITSAGFSGLIQRALVWQSSKLPHLFHCPCGADSFLVLMACQTYYYFTVTMPTNFYRTAFLIEHICRQNLNLNKTAVLCSKLQSASCAITLVTVSSEPMEPPLEPPLG